MWEDDNEGFVACFLIKKGNSICVVPVLSHLASAAAYDIWGHLCVWGFLFLFLFLWFFFGGAGKGEGKIHGSKPRP